MDSSDAKLKKLEALLKLVDESVRSFWSRQSFLYTPPPIQSCPKSRVFDSNGVRPGSNALTFSIILNKNIVSSVSALFRPSSPPTVFLGVVSVYVYAVKCGLVFSMFRNMLKVRLIHVASKLLKRGPLTLNTSSAISVVPNVLASGFAGNISLPKSSFGHSMGGHSFLRHFSGKASARLRVSCTKVVVACNSLFSARTYTIPVRMSTSSFNKGQNSKFSEGPARYIFPTHWLNYKLG